MNHPPIIEFQGAYRWLSNFAPVPLLLADGLYPSVEHAYQASKTLDASERAYVRESTTPGQAKSRGKYVTVRSDWEQIKVALMKELLLLKFEQNPYNELLLNTGEADIVEGNNWGDTFWGVCRGKGQNVLGRLIMDVRASLRQASLEHDPED